MFHRLCKGPLTSTVAIGSVLAMLVAGCSSSSVAKSADAGKVPTLSGKSGAELLLGDEVSVDTGKVHAPALAWDSTHKTLYAAWTRDSTVPGPWGSTLGTPYVASSTDGGKTFSRPVAVSSSPDVATQSPQALVVTKAGTLVDVWAHYAPNAKTPYGEFNMESARSTDGGKTFTVQSPHDGKIQQVSRPNVTATPDGRVWLTWLDGRPFDRDGDFNYDVRLAYSQDDGSTFTPSWVVKGSACNCCRAQLVQSPTNPATMALSWRDDLQKPGTENHAMQMDGLDAAGKTVKNKVWPKTDTRTIKVAVSTDGGHDFGAATSVNDFPWHIQACPTIGPSVFYDKDGKTLGVTWFTGAQGHVGVYFARSEDGGKTYSQPVQLSTDLVGEGYDFPPAWFDSKGNAWVAWALADSHVQVARISPGGEVSKTPVINGERVGLSATDGDPVVSYANDGKLVVRSVTK
jgi:hypothetical protein